MSFLSGCMGLSLPAWVSHSSALPSPFQKRPIFQGMKSAQFVTPDFAINQHPAHRKELEVEMP